MGQPDGSGDLALDVHGASLRDGAPVVQWTINGGDNQRRRFVPIDGRHQICSVNSRKCLTVGARMTVPRSAIVQSRCSAAETQQRTSTAADPATA